MYATTFVLLQECVIWVLLDLLLICLMNESIVLGRRPSPRPVVKSKSLRLPFIQPERSQTLLFTFNLLVIHMYATTFVLLSVKFAFGVLALLLQPPESFLAFPFTLYFERGLVSHRSSVKPIRF